MDSRETRTAVRCASVPKHLGLSPLEFWNHHPQEECAIKVKASLKPRRDVRAENAPGNAPTATYKIHLDAVRVHAAVAEVGQQVLRAQSAPTTVLTVARGTATAANRALATILQQNNVQPATCIVLTDSKSKRTGASNVPARIPLRRKLSAFRA